MCSWVAFCGPYTSTSIPRGNEAMEGQNCVSEAKVRNRNCWNTVKVVGLVCRPLTPVVLVWLWTRVVRHDDPNLSTLISPKPQDHLEPITFGTDSLSFFSITSNNNAFLGAAYSQCFHHTERMSLEQKRMKPFSYVWRETKWEALEDADTVSLNTELQMSSYQNHEFYIGKAHIRDK